MEMPPKVYLYSPQIKGFKIIGSRGSKYFNPETVSIYKNPQSKATCYTNNKPTNNIRNRMSL